MSLSTSVAVPSTAYPAAPHTLLKQSFVGKDVRDIDGPAAVLDIAPLRKNCEIMLRAVDQLQLDFRAHVKTHKTTEVTRLQLGDDRKSDARVVVSTIQEAIQQADLLAEYQHRGRHVNLLYGMPPSATAYARLKGVRQTLGNENVAFIVDNAVQLGMLNDPAEKSVEEVPVFVNVDVGYHREGITPTSRALEEILQAISRADGGGGRPRIKLLGFYSHNSLSYAANSYQDCMRYLLEELKEIRSAAERATQLKLVHGRITLSVGSSPPVLSVQNLQTNDPTGTELKHLLRAMKETFNVELHAGVYPILDMQQLASRSRPTSSALSPTMTEADLGLRVLADVLSVYAEREQPEALVGAGTLALGREPCKSYGGWGVVAPRPWREAGKQQTWSADDQTGWVVGRISQEHGILEWHGPRDRIQPLEVGEKLLIWPNHACITSAGYGWYVVVDSSKGPGQETRIVDVWIRCRGW